MKLEFSRHTLKKLLRRQILCKYDQWEPSCSMRTDTRTDTTKLIVAYRYFANAPKSRTPKCRGLRLRARRNRGSNSGRDKILFSSKIYPNRLYSPNSLLLNVYLDLFTELRWPRPGVDNTPPPSADIKNEWN
jgi:hypothetical protein